MIKFLDMEIEVVGIDNSRKKRDRYSKLLSCFLMFNGSMRFVVLHSISFGNFFSLFSSQTFKIHSWRKRKKGAILFGCSVVSLPLPLPLPSLPLSVRIIQVDLSFRNLRKARMQELARTSCGSYSTTKTRPLLVRYCHCYCHCCYDE